MKPYQKVDPATKMPAGPWYIAIDGIEYGPFKSYKTAANFAARLSEIEAAGGWQADFFCALLHLHREMKAQEAKQLVIGLIISSVLASVMINFFDRLADLWEETDLVRRLRQHSANLEPEPPDELSPYPEETSKNKSPSPGM